ncbi:oligosaccharide repeat unit polymerase, partial [bacterium]|nr:oligosaccharide repeat unit polymerase [bacterium]
IKKEFNYTAIFLILLTFIILLSLGGRMQLILFILTLFFINQLYLKPIKIIKLLVYGYFILLLLAIFPIIRSLVSSDIELDDVMVRTALRFLGKDEFNMLILPFFPFIYIITGDVTSIWDMFSGLYQHIHPFNDIEWGRFISQFFTMPIPRSLYTDKPIALGTYFSQYFEQVTSRGVSLGLLGELYWSFSFFGTFIGSFIFGLIISFFDKLYLKNKYNSFIILNHSILLSFTILFYRSPMSTVVKYIFFIIIAFTILFLARRKNEKIINT